MFAIVSPSIAFAGLHIKSRIVVSQSGVNRHYAITHFRLNKFSYTIPALYMYIGRDEFQFRYVGLGDLASDDVAIPNA